jgi:hypothetical protein
MDKKISYFEEPADFSLVQGGPLFQLLLRTGLLKPPTDLVTRRIVALLVIGWVPLLVLSVVAGHAFGGVAVPFLFDLGAQARLLLGVPVLLAADVIVHQRIRVVVRQFLDRGIVAPQDQPRFEGVIASAMRLRNSVIAELLVFAAAIIAGYFYWQRYISMGVPSWMELPINGRSQVTMAGYWYVYVSLMVLRFILFRWYFRLFVWAYFLWQVSRRVPLQLNALHPDRAGGLGFLAGSVFAYAPILIVHTISLSSTLGSKIWHEGAKLPQFKVEIAAWMIFLLMLAFAPLFFFMVQLAAAKRDALRDYGIVASRYVNDFRRKWFGSDERSDEPLVGTSDIQSLADLGNSFSVVQETRLLPFGYPTVLRLAILVAIPLLPLVLTMIPIEQLIDRALGVVF